LYEKNSLNLYQFYKSIIYIEMDVLEMPRELHHKILKDFRSCLQKNRIRNELSLMLYGLYDNDEDDDIIHD